MGTGQAKKVRVAIDFAILLFGTKDDKKHLRHFDGSPPQAAERYDWQYCSDLPTKVYSIGSCEHFPCRRPNSSKLTQIFFLIHQMLIAPCVLGSRGHCRVFYSLGQYVQTRLCCAALLVVLIGQAQTQAGADDFDRVVSFGDSLSDNGNLNAALSSDGLKFFGVLDDIDYFEGRFSNGPTFVGLIAGNANFAAGESSLARFMERFSL
jgi:hypothetical protein